MQTFKIVSTVTSCIILFAAILVGQQSNKEELPGIRNFTQVDATTACAGATSPEAITELKRRGFTSIINFRTESEDGATVEAGILPRDAAPRTAPNQLQSPMWTEPPSSTIDHGNI